MPGVHGHGRFQVAMQGALEVGDKCARHDGGGLSNTRGEQHSGALEWGGRAAPCNHTNLQIEMSALRWGRQCGDDIEWQRQRPDDERAYKRGGKITDGDLAPQSGYNSRGGRLAFPTEWRSTGRRRSNKGDATASHPPSSTHVRA